MKLEDVKIGMHLRDPKGNVWEILDIDNGSKIPCVYLRCVEFLHPVGVRPNLRIDTAAEAATNRWVYVNKKHFVVAPDSVIKQFKNYFATGQQSINVVTGLNESKTLIFVTQEQYDNVEVIIDDMVEVPKVQHLTRENIRVGLELRTASELSFTVIGYSDDGVLLRHILYSEIYKGVVKQISADLLVEWEDSTRPILTNVLTTKDFILVE